MSSSLNSLQAGIYGASIGVIEGETRSLDYSSCGGCQKLGGSLFEGPGGPVVTRVIAL